MKATAHLTYKYPIDLRQIRAITGQSISMLMKTEICKSTEHDVVKHIERIPHRKDAYTFLGGVWSPRLGMAMEEFDRHIELMSIKKNGRIMKARCTTPQELLSFVSTLDNEEDDDNSSIVAFDGNKSIMYNLKRRGLSIHTRYNNPHSTICSYLLAFDPIQ